MSSVVLIQQENFTKIMCQFYSNKFHCNTGQYSHIYHVTTEYKIFVGAQLGMGTDADKAQIYPNKKYCNKTDLTWRAYPSDKALLHLK